MGRKSKDEYLREALATVDNYWNIEFAELLAGPGSQTRGSDLRSAFTALDNMALAAIDTRRKKPVDGQALDTQERITIGTLKRIAEHAPNEFEIIINKLIGNDSKAHAYTLLGAALAEIREEVGFGDHSERVRIALSKQMHDCKGYEKKAAQALDNVALEIIRVKEGHPKNAASRKAEEVTQTLLKSVLENDPGAIERVIGRLSGVGDSSEEELRASARQIIFGGIAEVKSDEKFHDTHDTKKTLSDKLREVMEEVLETAPDFYAPGTDKMQRIALDAVHNLARMDQQMDNEMMVDDWGKDNTLGQVKQVLEEDPAAFERAIAEIPGKNLRAHALKLVGHAVLEVRRDPEFSPKLYTLEAGSTEFVGAIALFAEMLGAYQEKDEKIPPAKKWVQKVTKTYHSPEDKLAKWLWDVYGPDKKHGAVKMTEEEMGYAMTCAIEVMAQFKAAGKTEVLWSEMVKISENLGKDGVQR